jgi:hypothetical protein
LLLAAAVVAPPVPATPVAENPADDPRIQLPTENGRKRNRLTIGSHLGLNIKSNFKNRPGTAATSNPGPATGGGFSRTYDDGFVAPDVTFPNNNGMTFFWGYQNASQVGANDLFFHSAGGVDSGADSRDASTDPQLGLELTYSREVGSLGKGFWGLELGLSYTDLSIDDSHPRTGMLSLTTDAYSLGNPPIIVPAAPYMGSFGGPGPAISDSPVRTVAQVPADVRGKRELEGSVFGLRLGPYYQYPLAGIVSVRVSAGLAAAVVDSRFSYSETVTTAQGGPVSRRGRDSGTDVLVGGYVAGQMTATVRKNVDLFAGVQYQSLGSFNRKAPGKEAEVRLNNSVFVNVGVGFSF